MFSSTARLLSELKRRKVFRVALVYAVVAWVTIEVTDTVFPHLGLPEWTVTLVVALAVVGAPIALVLAWALEVTPEGVKRTEALEAAPGAAGAGSFLGSRRAAAVFGSGMLVALIGFGGYAYLGERHDGGERGAIGSIAVLPFADMSAEGDQSYFGDGIAEELLDALAKIDGLRVAARTSSFSYRGENIDVRRIGADLNVQAVLEGSVRRDGSRVRITAQLIDAASGYHLWSDSYQRDLTDIFALQDEVSRAIVEALRVQLPGGSPLVEEQTTSSEAHNLYLRARHEWRKRTPEAVRASVDLFQQAVDADPLYARAWAGLAEALVILPGYTAADPDAAHARAAAAARSSIELDPTLADPHAVLGMIAASEQRFNDAERAFRRALELNPNLATGHHWYGMMLFDTGRVDAALESMLRAQELDPLSSPIATNVGHFLYQLRRDEEALAHFDRWERTGGGGYQTTLMRAAVLSAMGRHEEALAGLPAALDDAEGYAQALAMGAYVYGRAGERERALELIRGLEQLAREGHVPVRELVLAHIGVGDLEAAVDAMERSVEAGELGPIPEVLPRQLDPLRGHPRFERLLERARGN